MYDYRLIEEQLQTILSSLGLLLSEAELEEAQHFIDVGEYGLAFETLCGIIDEEQKMLPLTVYYLIADLGTQMEIDPAIWAKLKVRQKSEVWNLKERLKSRKVI